MAVSTLPSPGTRIRSTVYWTATVLIAAELGVGGVWDVARIPRISWCCWAFGRFWALALLVPGRPLPKEWAYAGAFFVYTGAIASHLTERYAPPRGRGADGDDRADGPVVGAAPTGPTTGTARSLRA